ncbi:MAG: D-glycero-beta-D-manno-heptose 1-phosphate adenylyltransferase [Deltaproteobacteria bacterium]|nr:D-glycero-beta-D-manno-heptose 1-phosphate adenylyltransferase [Deltaproteobacteria bacterium]MBM4322702.1 D-glycero-beta-D-manno-heptose 1-phosphate adenylyltransferase [Deltaproteobacteria bacterium]
MMKEKIKTREAISQTIENLKSNGKRIVFTNGCFDILHVGHIRYLEKARSLGDILVVGLNSDRSVRTIKGPERPILPEQERAEILSGLWCVDYITLFNEPIPLELITSIKPHVLVKGGDWTKETTVGKEVVEGSGGEVVILPFVEGSSTTNIIETILKRFLEKSRNL